MDDLLQILLIDDDDIDRMAVRRALRSSDLKVEVSEAASGRDGLAVVRTRPFDCVLMDYGLPDRDGLTVLREARAAGLKFPIIMLTAQGDEELAVEIMKAGASDYLAKSRLSLDRLVHSVRNAVKLHRARSEAEAAQHRLAFLAEASKVLAASLNYEETLAAVARLSVPRIGDWCSIVMVGPDRILEQLAVAHVDPAKLHIAEEFRAKYPARWEDVRGVANVIRTGTPELYPEISEELLISAARDPEHLRMMRALKMKSGMVVPLTSRGQVLGVIAFIAAESGRRFDAADLALAEDLARRAAVAVDNARLYRRTQEALVSKDESSGLLDTLLATAPVGMAFFDRELRYVRINEALAAINGLPAKDHLGKTIGEMLPEIASDELTRQMRGVLETGQSIVNADVRGTTPADPGLMHDYLVSFYPVRSRGGEMIGLGVTVLDITERKRAERELQEAKDAAVAANASKDQFLAVLSHELRTPLTPVLTTVQELETDLRLPGEVLSAVQMIRRNVELEARLIDDLLDLTRIAKGKLQLAMGTVDAHALLRSVLEICESDVVSKQQVIEVRLGAQRPYVRADSARLQQIFWNLMKNAVKFTPERGRITIATSNDEAGNLHVQVADTGIGIDPEVLPRIFDAFEQGERSVTRRFGGLGLGLAITRALVDAHRGRLDAASGGRGEGATFTLLLPAVNAPAPQPREPVQPPPNHAASLVRILLVDDHEDTSRAMKRLLERVGYQVRTASTVAGALQAATAGPFDLLISDIGLPDGSGLDLIRQLRRAKPIKAIALSGFGMEEDLQKSRDAGFMEHLTKPVNFEHLESLIRQLTAHGPADPRVSASTSPRMSDRSPTLISPNGASPT